MRETYKEYVKEHPEELVGINRLKKHSRAIDRERKARKKEALKMVQKWKERLNGDDNSGWRG